MARARAGRDAGLLIRIARATDLDPRKLALLSALLVVWIGFHLLSEGSFLTARNLYNLAVQSSVVGIMACGMVLVIVARHIDLSVGSVLGFTGMVIAWLQVDLLPLGAPWNWPLTILVGLVLGAVIGCWQGYWVAYRGISAFMVTLAGLLIFRGMAFLVTDGRTVAPLDPDYQVLGGGIEGSIGATWSWICGAAAICGFAVLAWRSRRSRLKHGFAPKPLLLELALIAAMAALVIGFVLVMNAYSKPRSEVPRGIPVPVLILIAVALAMAALARFTRFGRYVYAMGGNPEAAELCGIRVKRVTLWIFVVMGLLSAVAAVVTTARLNAGVNSMGMMAELSVIAATVIGGTALGGGRGSILGAVLGAVIMQSLENGMVLLGASSALRQVVIGLVLIAAVWSDRAFRGKLG